MMIYILNVAIIVVCGIIYNIIDTNKNNEKFKTRLKSILLKIPFIAIYLTLALKANYVGTDIAPAYEPSFFSMQQISFSEILDFTTGNLLKNFERGFLLITKIIYEVFNNFQIYMAILYLIMIILLYKFIKENSKMPFISLLLFLRIRLLYFF